MGRRCLENKHKQSVCSKGKPPDYRDLGYIILSFLQQSKRTPTLKCAPRDQERSTGNDNIRHNFRPSRYDLESRPFDLLSPPDKTSYDRVDNRSGRGDTIFLDIPCGRYACIRSCGFHPLAGRHQSR